MSLNTLNIKQKQGGRVVKQADRSSTFKFALQDANGALINLNGQEADISLFNPNIKKYWSSKAKVKDAEVEFKLPGNIEENDYVLEITVGGYVFPSDNDFIIEVVKGFRDLPEMETGLRYKQTIEEITQDYIERSDDKLKENLDGITDQRVKIDKANAEILKNINDTGSEYINDINTNYANVKLAFGKNASQKNEELKNNYDTYVKNLENKKDDVITLIGNKKEEVFTEIDGQVKISTDQYLNDYTNKLNDKVDKVAGKELSDNNFTNQDKAKVDNIKDPWEIIHFDNFYKDKFGTETMDDTVDNWLKIPSGYYYVRPDNIKNQPNDYALMRVINVGSIDVIWETMNIGPVYRKSGDKSGISEWKIISQ